MDKDGNGFIESNELSGSDFQVTRTVIRQGETSPAPAKTGLADFDRDGDRRVSRAEFLGGMNALTDRTR